MRIPAALFIIAIAVIPAPAQETWNQVFPLDVPPPKGFRANRGAYSPLMEVLRSSRPEVTDRQLEQLKVMQVEDLWDGMGEYRDTNYVRGFQMTRPGERLVGRALTMRYLPPRPDVKRAAQQLAAEGNWDNRFNIRAGEEARPGDVVVVDQGGPEGSIFLGDLSALGIMMRGAAGVIVDGGVRDAKELRGASFDRFPIFARFFDARANWWVGVDWDVPVRVGTATVLPGDIVVADEGGVLFIPPELVAPILQQAASSKKVEERQRELIKERKFRLRDVYPLHPKLKEEFDKDRK